MNKFKKKSNAGRKPLADKKMLVCLYVRQSIIDKLGGIKKVQEYCYKRLEIEPKI